MLILVTGVLLFTKVSPSAHAANAADPSTIVGCAGAPAGFSHVKFILSAFTKIGLPSKQIPQINPMQLILDRDIFISFSQFLLFFCPIMFLISNQ
jgi:hypothetical protein